MLKLAPILKEISKDFRMGGHDGSGGHDGKLHQAFTLVMEWEAVEYLKVSRWDQKSQITTVEIDTYLHISAIVGVRRSRRLWNDCCRSPFITPEPSPPRRRLRGP